MSERNPVAPLLAALRALVRWLSATRVRGAVIGGVAAALLGRPRMTGDIDALVLLEDGDWETFVAAGARFGIRVRRPDAIAFARRSRVLLLRHDPSGIDVDVSIGALPFEHDVVGRARRHRVAGLAVPLATAEDLIVMKAIAHRPRDIADIEGLRDVRHRLDRRRILRVVREFADLLEMPEIASDLERILGVRKRHSSGRRRRAR